jgi:hypothetical protein
VALDAGLIHAGPSPRTAYAGHSAREGSACEAFDVDSALEVAPCVRGRSPCCPPCCLPDASRVRAGLLHRRDPDPPFACRARFASRDSDVSQAGSACQAQCRFRKPPAAPPIPVNPGRFAKSGNPACRDGNVFQGQCRHRCRRRRRAKTATVSAPRLVAAPHLARVRSGLRVVGVEVTHPSLESRRNRGGERVGEHALGELVIAADVAGHRDLRAAVDRRLQDARRRDDTGQ